MGGAFQTSREIFNNPIWQDVSKFRIFFFIVGNAVFSNDGVRISDVHIKRGQFLRSYRNLCDDLQYIENRKVKKYSISVISRKIDSLVKEERLKIESTELGTLFTVVNYEEYQRLENYKAKLGTELEQGWNTVGTELEQSGNNNKKDNKDKNVKKDKKEEKNCPKQVYDDTSLYYQLSLYFFERIKLNNPDHKQPDFQIWSDEIRKMIKLDNRTDEQVKYLMKWVQEDDFEKANVLSPTKLRKRFDNLIMKVKQQKIKQPNKRSIFEQGEESKKRQEEIKPLSTEEQEQMKKWEEELPY